MDESIGDLITPSKRASLFARRNTWAGIILLITILSAGLILHVAEQHKVTANAFLILFAGAFLARLFSAWCLSRYPAVSYHSKKSDYFSFFEFIKRTPHSNFAKFVFFFGAMTGAVTIAGPYLAVFMLRELKFSYLQFMLISALGTGAQFIMMRVWGPVADMFGTKKILNLCGIGICFLPLLWLISHNLIFLVIVQCLGGLLWAGFALAGTTFLFDAVTPGKRGRCTAYMAVVTNAFSFCGAFLGGMIIPTMIAIYPTVIQWPIVGQVLISPYQLLFIVSTIVRVAVAIWFLRLFHEVRDVPAITYRRIILHITNLRPIAGPRISALGDS